MTNTTIAAILANIARQARYPERAVLITGEAAQALLEYIGALERDGNGWRSVAAVRQERIAEAQMQPLLFVDEG